jgi:hypothetical protein
MLTYSLNVALGVYIVFIIILVIFVFFNEDFYSTSNHLNKLFHRIDADTLRDRSNKFSELLTIFVLNKMTNTKSTIERELIDASNLMEESMSRFNVNKGFTNLFIEKMKTYDEKMDFYIDSKRVSGNGFAYDTKYRVVEDVNDDISKLFHENVRSRVIQNIETIDKTISTMAKEIKLESMNSFIFSSQALSRHISSFAERIIIENYKLLIENK